MITDAIQVTILFFVIFDPLASLFVYHNATHLLPRDERRKIAILAALIALSISYLFLFSGNHILTLFNTTLDEFRIAGGIILGMLGVRMTLGYPLRNLDSRKDTAWGIAAIIGTPLLTGPAAISAIMIARNDYGILLTAVAILIVMILTVLIFFKSYVFIRLGPVFSQITTTILGLITLTWGVGMVLTGIKAIIL